MDVKGWRRTELGTTPEVELLAMVDGFHGETRRKRNLEIIPRQLDEGGTIHQARELEERRTDLGVGRWRATLSRVAVLHEKCALSCRL